MIYTRISHDAEARVTHQIEDRSALAERHGGWWCGSNDRGAP
jgi:hypothetical protein